MTTLGTPGNEELAKTRAELRKAGADFGLLSSIHNVTYASNWEVPVKFGAMDANAYTWPLLLVAAKDDAAWLILPDGQLRSATEAARVSAFYTTATLDSFNPTDPAGSLEGALESALCDAGINGGSGTIAVEARTLPFFVARYLQDALPEWSITEADEPLQRARWIKTSREIALLRKASAVSDAAQTALADEAKQVGKSEFAMFAEISRRSLRRSGTRHSPLRRAGHRATLNHGALSEWSTHRTTEAGDAALMDLSGRVNGYWFDCTNTHVIGARADRRTAPLCDGQPGRLRSGDGRAETGSESIDAANAAEAAFASFGLPMAHYAGHQIGVTVNEFPRLVPYDHRTIEPGMVFSVEPGAYQGPGGTFGARSEKMVLVTEVGSGNSFDI